MTIYFTFSDESGLYKQNRDHRFNELHPFYIRASFIMDGREWKDLDYLLCSLKGEYQIPPTLEIKYSDLFSILQHQNHPERIVDPRLTILMGYSIEMLKEFIERSVSLLNALENPQIIITISKNDRFGTPTEKDLYTWHIQNLLQRIQFDLDANDPDNENLCLIFLDPVSERVNKILMESYNNLFIYGDRFMNFSKIKDCLHFELSHHSCGIQIADYIAGITFGFLQNRDYSVGVFNRQISHLIRTRPHGKIMGYGIIEIPTNRRVRTFLSEQFQVE